MRSKSILLFTILFVSGIVAYAQTAAPENIAKAISNDAALSKGYLLGPGDQVAGGVPGETGYDFVGAVDDDGILVVPFMKKSIVAQCHTVPELKSEIEAEVKKYLRDPFFSFRLTESHSRPPVSVSGEIMKQMEIILTRKATLIEILSIGGGPKEEASGQIQVFRTQPPLCIAENDPDNWKSNSSDPKDVPSRTYSWVKVQAGKVDSNPTIYPGDRIVLLRALPVYVNGEVVGAQGVYLKEDGLSLVEAISKVGGPRPQANKKNVAIYRLKAGSNPDSKDRELISANFDLIMKGQQKDIMLQPYDLVIVDKAKKSVGAILGEIALSAARTLPTSFSNTIPYKIIY